MATQSFTERSHVKRNPLFQAKLLDRSTTGRPHDAGPMGIIDIQRRLISLGQ